MRRRPPRCIELSAEDVAYLQRLVQDGRTEQRVARRARALLAMADPETVVQDVADRLELRRETIWQLCRRYEQVGVKVVEDAHRHGRPRTFLVSAARGDRATGVLRTCRAGAAHDPRVDAQPRKGRS